MSGWILSFLDIVVIALIGAALVQATRLIKHLTGLRQGRIDMERFVHEFNATVIRAEAGIKGLRQAARDSGDDLEKLVEKAVLLRDELQYIVQSGERIAERLSQAATGTMRPEPAKAAAKPAEKPQAPTGNSEPTPMTARKTETPAAAPSSKAEKELLQALQKLSS